MTSFDADNSFGHRGVQFLLNNAVASSERMTIAEFFNSFNAHIEAGTAEKRIETIIGRDSLLAGIADRSARISEDMTLSQVVEQYDPTPPGSITHPMLGTDIVTGVRSLTAYAQNINLWEKEPGDAADWEKEYGKTYTGVVKALLGSVEGWDIDLEIRHGTCSNRRVEVKSIRNFLSRYHSNQPELNLDEGSLYFELYNQPERDSSYGSLYHMLYPDLASREGCVTKILDPQIVCAQSSTLPAPARRTTYLAPDYLVYLLYLTRTDPHPFAAVSFEWKSLKDKLATLREDIWPRWQIPEYDVVSREPWVVKNCWHVPMTELVDAASITMIEPIDTKIVDAIVGKDSHKRDLMRKRYKFLRDHKQATIRV